MDMARCFSDFDPTVNIIKEISLKGKNPTNITFDGNNRKQCFVTVSDMAVQKLFAQKNLERCF